MATIKDIARLAGVSHGTASNVLNGKGNVSSAKIVAVQKAAKQLGYTVNLTARGLRSVDSRKLAVVVPNLYDQMYVDFFCSFKATAEENGYTSLLSLSDNHWQKEKKQIATLRSENVSGVAALTLYSGSDNIYEKRGFPARSILYLRHQPNQQCSFMGFDTALAGAEMAKKALSYTCIAVMTEDPAVSTQLAFLDAFRAGLEAHPEIQVTYYTKAESERAISVAMHIFDAAQPPQAVFTMNFTHAQYVRNVQRSFFPEHQVPIYSLSPMFTIPEAGFHPYEFNYRLLGREAALQLLGQLNDTAPLKARLLDSNGFPVWVPSVLPAPCHKLKVLTLESPAAHIMQEMSRLYTKHTGTQLSIDIMPYDDIHRVLTRLDESTPYDVIRLDATWLSWFAPRIFEPLSAIDPHIENALGDFIPGLTSLYGRQNDVLYALPETPSPQMLFYRKDLFENPVLQRLYKERYRDSLRPPQTFEEYNRIAKFFTKAYNPSSPVSYGSTLTLGNTGVAATEFLTRYFALNPHLFGADDALLLTGGDSICALEQLLAVSHYAAPQPCPWWRDTAQFFSRGDVAMTVLFTNYASDLLGAQTRIRTSIGYAMVPGGNPLLGGGSIGVCRYSRHKEDALNYIRWFCSKEVSSATTLLGSVSPCQDTYRATRALDTYPWLSLTEKCFAASHTFRVPANAPQGFDERGFLDILGSCVMEAVNGSQPIALSLQKACDCYRQSAKK